MKHIQKEVTRHGKTVYYYRRGENEPRIRMPDDFNSYEFAVRYQELHNSTPEDLAKRTTAEKRRRHYLERDIRQKAKHARIRDTHKRAVTSKISADWAVDKLRQQDYRCAVTGLDFRLFDDWKGRLQPFAPSLDRIDNKRGYEIENVQIVILAYNMMRLDWGSDVFDMVIEGYLANKHSRTQNPVLPHLSSGSTKSAA